MSQPGLNTSRAALAAGDRLRTSTHVAHGAVQTRRSTLDAAGRQCTSDLSCATTRGHDSILTAAQPRRAVSTMPAAGHERSNNSGFQVPARRCGGRAIRAARQQDSQKGHTALQSLSFSISSAWLVGQLVTAIRRLAYVASTATASGLLLVLLESLAPAMRDVPSFVTKILSLCRAYTQERILHRGLPRRMTLLCATVSTAPLVAYYATSAIRSHHIEEVSGTEEVVDLVDAIHEIHSEDRLQDCLQIRPPIRSKLSLELGTVGYIGSQCQELLSVANAECQMPVPDASAESLCQMPVPDASAESLCQMPVPEHASAKSLCQMPDASAKSLCQMPAAGAESPCQMPVPAAGAESPSQMPDAGAQSLCQQQQCIDSTAASSPSCAAGTTSTAEPRPMGSLGSLAASSLSCAAGTVAEPLCMRSGIIFAGAPPEDFQGVTGSIAESPTSNSVRLGTFAGALPEDFQGVAGRFAEPSRMRPGATSVSAPPEDFQGIAGTEATARDCGPETANRDCESETVTRDCGPETAIGDFEPQACSMSASVLPFCHESGDPQACSMSALPSSIGEYIRHQLSTYSVVGPPSAGAADAIAEYSRHQLRADYVVAPPPAPGVIVAMLPLSVRSVASAIDAAQLSFVTAFAASPPMSFTALQIEVEERRQENKLLFIDLYKTKQRLRDATIRKPEANEDAAPSHETDTAAAPTCKVPTMGIVMSCRRSAAAARRARRQQSRWADSADAVSTG